GQQDVTLTAAARAVTIPEKKQVWRRTEKYAATPDLDPAGKVEMRQVLSLRPDSDFVGLAGSGGIFQDLDAISRRAIFGCAPGVFITFHDQETAARLHREP